jgi:dienelactone hydrolase
MTFATPAATGLCLILCTLYALDSTAAAESSAGASQEVVKIWTGKPPGTEAWSKAETVEQVQSPDAGRAIQIIKNVTQPTLTVFRSSSERATGAGMIVLPGGAWGALAWDLEGIEIARWLTDRGITAFVLKYRIHEADAALTSKMTELFGQPPGPNRFDELMKLMQPRRQIAIDDAMQAMRVVRSEAKKYAVAPDRIGMMGFSAGAITTMSVVLESNASTRPNFAAPIYGANASDKAPTKDAPPLFIAVAADDTLTSASKNMEILQAWQSAGASAELHVYEKGGHGFGLGKAGTTSARWPADFEAWLAVRGLTSAQRQ